LATRKERKKNYHNIQVIKQTPILSALITEDHL